MGHIHAQNEEFQEALSAWVTVYRIAKPMGLAQALDALGKLAPQLGMPEGLDGWERLAQRAEAGGDQSAEKSELEQITEFVQELVRAVREESSETEKYFEAVSKMAVDSEVTPAYRALGKVFQSYMSGVKQLDLSALPDELAKIVREALES
jgi:hypothetical protein